MGTVIAEQIETIRTRYPQAHAVAGDHGQHLIVVPSVLLPKGWNKNICTALFVAPTGFPCIRPSDFWLDVTDLRLTEKKYMPFDRPQFTGEHNPIPGFDNWKELTWFGWKLQAWSPVSTLYTYLMVIRQRLSPAR